MSSAGTRERKTQLYWDRPTPVTSESGLGGSIIHEILAEGRQKTVSESHRRNPNTGNYDAGGPFYTSRVSYFLNSGHVSRARWPAQGKYYSGPLRPAFPTSTEISSVGADPTKPLGIKDDAALAALGTTAISQSAPTNPASNLGTTLAEIHREGIPSLPGIKLWKGRTAAAKAAGSEYLNAEFGWLPLVDEVNQVGSAARHSRDLMNQYRHSEGRDTHRRFDFPLQRTENTINVGNQLPLGVDSHFFNTGVNVATRSLSLVNETERWFEGCYTYALPSSTDSWRRGIGFGSQADHLFGLTLTPDVLWELTPWSWAVDWFSNAGDVINNVTNFGLAGLVLRYGFIMEETRSIVAVNMGPQACFAKAGQPTVMSESASCGYEIVTKRRSSASPFGFSIGWEGLSPTQLAITAALGITRLL